MLFLWAAREWLIWTNWQSTCREKPNLVSVMWVNNETGVIQPIGKIAKLCKEYGAILHVDAAQALGKIDVSIKKIPVDLMSLSAHKVYGPKGIGALIVRRGVDIMPLMSGGGQERQLRPGTLPVPLIVGFGKAIEIQAKERAKLAKSAKAWHDRIKDRINELGNVKINGDQDSKVPHILNASFKGISGDLIAAMPKVALSNSSACTTQKVMASHVLMGMGLTKAQALGSLRISFGRYTTKTDVKVLISEISRVVPVLRS